MFGKLCCGKIRVDSHSFYSCRPRSILPSWRSTDAFLEGSPVGVGAAALGPFADSLGLHPLDVVQIGVAVVSIGCALQQVFLELDFGAAGGVAEQQEDLLLQRVGGTVAAADAGVGRKVNSPSRPDSTLRRSCTIALANSAPNKANRVMTPLSAMSRTKASPPAGAQALRSRQLGEASCPAQAAVGPRLTERVVDQIDSPRNCCEVMPVVEEFAGDFAQRRPGGVSRRRVVERTCELSAS